jgi:alpha-amylase/alpha-mannosidase (GH57 family)
MVRGVLIALVGVLSSAAIAQEAEEPIMVALLWHQHQPHYLQSPETGEYAMPWVRLHATKDYWDMVAMLEDHPDVRFTVNLTPVLIDQIQDLLRRWEAGEATDAFVRHTLIDADELTDEEKAFILRNFFSLNWDRILERFPRYVELRDKRPGVGEAEIQGAIEEWTAQDFRDLQMLFNLGWMDPDFREGATFADGSEIKVGHWVERGRDYSEADKRALIETHFRVLAQVIPIHRAMQDRDRIEVTTTPFYHPILPLICDTSLAREAVEDLPLPGERFRWPADASEHVALAAEQYQGLFGRPPRGLWPGEGGVAEAVVPLFAEAGLRWFATDVQVLARSIGEEDPPASQRFSMWRCGGEDDAVGAIFRDTGLSDRIGFTYSSWDGEEAARDFVGILHSIREVMAGEVERPLSQHVIPIILDGENCWEYYENDGKAFLHTLYTLLAEDPLLETVTISECLARSGELPVIERLHAGSWINANFETWIGEEEENRAWELLAEARQAVAEAEIDDPAAAAESHRLLLIAEGSDWFWWYGDDQSVDNEESFDEGFRGTLKQAYVSAGLDPPASLDEPIMGGADADEGGGAMAPGQ